MNMNDYFVFNMKEVRRRSIKVWKAIPQDKLNWKPDDEALTCAETIRHLLEGEFLYHQILIGRGSQALANVTNPFENREFTSVDDELAFAKPYHEAYLKYIQTLDTKEFDIEVDRSNVGYVRTIGDMLLRIAYHESVHTGQLLDYMRTMGIDRPMIWD